MAQGDRSPDVFAVAILFFVLTWLTVGLRVYVRAILMKRWGKDDSCMVAALVWVNLFCICTELC
jgi:amino acid permease